MNVKQRAIAMVKLDGRLIKDVADELSVSSRQVYNWLIEQRSSQSSATDDEHYFDIYYTLALAS